MMYHSRHDNPYSFDTLHEDIDIIHPIRSLQQYIPPIPVPLLRPLNNLITHCPALSVRAVLETLSKALRREPVTKILLVEARLATTRRVPLQRPIARRVGCERLVDEDELVADEPKLELGVCYDESARGCMLRSSSV